MSFLTGSKNKAAEVYAIVGKIPKGKVTTYGAIAKIANLNPRQVGWFLHRNPNPAQIPCHRVVNSLGKLASHFAFGGVEGQKTRLLAEGLVVEGDRINLQKCMWLS